MPIKIPWIKNEAFDPNYEFAESLDATDDELKSFQPESEETSDDTFSDPQIYHEKSTIF